MFDPALGEDAWLDHCAAGLDLIDEADVVLDGAPVVSDAEFAQWAAELEGHPTPSPGQVVAAGASQPITPTIVAQLAAVDPAALDDETRLALCLAWSRVRNYADGKLGRAIATQDRGDECCWRTQGCGALRGRAAGCR